MGSGFRHTTTMTNRETPESVAIAAARLLAVPSIIPTNSYVAISTVMNFYVVLPARGEDEGNLLLCRDMETAEKNVAEWLDSAE